MPGVLVAEGVSRKRKRTADSSEPITSRRLPKSPKQDSKESSQAHILTLEQQISESSEHYNNFQALHKYVQNVDKKPKTAILAAVAECRSFCRLIADERLARPSTAPESQIESAKWLKARLQEFCSEIAGWIGSPDATQESTALTLLMRIVKAETSGTSASADHAWRSEKGTFFTLIDALASRNDAEGGRQEFVEKYVEEHDDVRFYTFIALKRCLTKSGQAAENVTTNVLDMLSQVEGIPGSEDQLEDWYGAAPAAGKQPLLSLSGHRKAAREAWLALFRSSLNDTQRKKVLGIMNVHVLPWFVGHLELVADFLTDSFDSGGSTSLLALSGIFNLITERNLDYPDFYDKLYSLLDEDILHSKYRSRFFRLFETFLNSTHLPVAMVASFIKRLSRLSLEAPPGAIVWIVPWIYNTMKQHPPCTFMLHRAYHPAHNVYASNPKLDDEGMDDPFDMTQRDPMLTGAIDSSLWEMETLRNHYHPNVATLAKILGEQFTKRDYSLEDFLDHSYASLLDAELGKEIKKNPVVEWEIPKRIVTSDDGLNGLGALLKTAMQGQ